MKMLIKTLFFNDVDVVGTTIQVDMILFILHVTLMHNF